MARLCHVNLLSLTSIKVGLFSVVSASPTLNYTTDFYYDIYQIINVIMYFIAYYKTLKLIMTNEFL